MAEGCLALAVGICGVQAMCLLQKKTQLFFSFLTSLPTTREHSCGSGCSAVWHVFVCRTAAAAAAAAMAHVVHLVCKLSILSQSSKRGKKRGSEPAERHAKAPRKENVSVVLKRRCLDMGCATPTHFGYGFVSALFQRHIKPKRVYDDLVTYSRAFMFQAKETHQNKPANMRNSWIPDNAQRCVSTFEQEGQLLHKRWIVSVCTPGIRSHLHTLYINQY